MCVFFRSNNNYSPFINVDGLANDDSSFDPSTFALYKSFTFFKGNTRRMGN